MMTVLEVVALGGWGGMSCDFLARCLKIIQICLSDNESELSISYHMSYVICDIQSGGFSAHTSSGDYEELSGPAYLRFQILSQLIPCALVYYRTSPFPPTATENSSRGKVHDCTCLNVTICRVCWCRKIIVPQIYSWQ